MEGVSRAWLKSVWIECCSPSSQHKVYGKQYTMYCSKDSKANTLKSTNFGCSVTVKQRGLDLSAELLGILQDLGKGIFTFGRRFHPNDVFGTTALVGRGERPMSSEQRTNEQVYSLQIKTEILRNIEG